MADFHLKVSDRLPVLEATLMDSQRRPIDVSTATDIKFKMRRSKSDTWIIITATKIDDGTEALRGRVDVPWGASDTDESGTYKGLFKVTLAGLVLSVPNSGCKSISIEDDC
jgi:hypothetical protein